MLWQRWEPKRSAHRTAPELNSAPAAPLLQEPTALSTDQWPHALHLLAHVYAGRL